MSRYNNRKKKRVVKSLIKDIENKGYFAGCDGNFYKAVIVPDPKNVTGSGFHCYEVVGVLWNDESIEHVCDLWNCCGGAYTLTEIREGLKNDQNN